MALPLFLFFNASKVLGVVGLLGVAANAVSYRRFKKKNLDPFRNPIDELQDALAEFPIDKDEDDDGFFFGLATAPAHVEDQLDDAWIRFAKCTPPDKTKDDGRTSSTGRDDEPIAGDEAQKDPTEPTEQDILIEEKKGNSPPFVEEWEVINENQEKSKETSPSALEGVCEFEGESVLCASSEKLLEHSRSIALDANTDESRLSRAKSTTEEPLLQLDIPGRGKKLVKIAMEAMIRGYQIFADSEEKPNVAAWHNVPNPEQRLRFWTDPDTEIKLAQGANVKVFRMGVDWTRVMPVEPLDGIEQSVDWDALHRYEDIIKRVRAHGMRVMLTLFHHSLPPWAGAYGGWKVEKTVDYFLEFVRIAVEKFSSLVDFWITFNEPHVFTMLTYCAGTWPGGDPNLIETATAVLPRGVYNKVMHMMANAHTKAYDIIHKFCDETQRRVKIGVSHHVSFMRPYGLFDISAVVFTDQMTRFPYIDEICHKLDFIGINYYGQEVVSAPGLKLVENDEYSESGRGVYPDGLYRVLVAFHERYRKYNLSYIITENGVSDVTDYIRRPYLIEHLLAVRAAMNKGIPIQGYCFWTISDNWEWADGYGPKFGLVTVDREKDLRRIPRPSYYLFAEICKNGKITKEQRNKAWAELQAVVVEEKKRPFCRSVDKNGLMYAGGLDVPIQRPFVKRDWRFGHYQFDGLQDPLSRLFRLLGHMAFGWHRHSTSTDDVPSDGSYGDPSDKASDRSDVSVEKSKTANVLVAA